MEAPKKASLLPKICHTYPKMIKLGTVIPYLKKIQKKNTIHMTRHLSYADIIIFLTGNQQLLFYQEIQI